MRYLGRNEQSQLGQPESIGIVEMPTLIEGLADVNIIQAACGRNHTLFLTGWYTKTKTKKKNGLQTLNFRFLFLDCGIVYACGDNRNGQCGVGKVSPKVLTPTRINYRGPQIIKVACGADFSVILDLKGNLYTFGLPEYGQLGNWKNSVEYLSNVK